MKERLQHNCEVFTNDSVAVLLDVLYSVKSNQLFPRPIVLTTPFASRGIDFLFREERAYLVLTEAPGTYSELVQMGGRGVRTKSELPIIGTILTQSNLKSIKALEIGARYDQQSQQYFAPDHLKALSHLQLCQALNLAKPVIAFEGAVQMLNANSSADAIFNHLCKAPKFKALLIPGTSTSSLKRKVPPASLESLETSSCKSVQSTLNFPKRQRQ